MIICRPKPDTLPPRSRPSLGDVTLAYDGRTVDWGVVDQNIWNTHSAKVEPRQKCTFCGSRCEDIRGNCGACGAPFDDDLKSINLNAESCAGTPTTTLGAMRGLSDAFMGLRKAIGEAIIGDTETYNYAVWDDEEIT